MIRRWRHILFLLTAALPSLVLLMLMVQTQNEVEMLQDVTDERVINEMQGAYVSSTLDPEEVITMEGFLKVRSRMRERNVFLKDQCSKLGLDDASYEAYAWEYLINRQYHVIWCNVFKAASTSWMYNFNLMANYSAEYLNRVTTAPVQLARERYPRPSVEEILAAQGDSVTFLIVRHPLERLASAYKDKFMYAAPVTYYTNTARFIIKTFRNRTEPKPSEVYPLFEEFVSYVLAEAAAVEGAAGATGAASAARAAGVVGAVGEARARALDMHWAPVTDFCTPCKFSYDALLKFETLDEDQRYLIRLAGLQGAVRAERLNSGRAGAEVNDLYARLSRAQLDSLIELYKYDFQLFNYTYDEYYRIVEGQTL